MSQWGSCAKCERDMVPGCVHLDEMYAQKTMKGMTDRDFIIYALNRMWALERDNKHKAAGDRAQRTYKSRNVKASEVLALKCHVRKGPFQCMRNAGHPANDLDDKGSHKF